VIHGPTVAAAAASGCAHRRLHADGGRRRGVRMRAACVGGGGAQLPRPWRPGRMRSTGRVPRARPHARAFSLATGRAPRATRGSPARRVGGAATAAGGVAAAPAADLAVGGRRPRARRVPARGGGWRPRPRPKREWPRRRRRPRRSIPPWWRGAGAAARQPPPPVARRPPRRLGAGGSAPRRRPGGTRATAFHPLSRHRRRRGVYRRAHEGGGQSHGCVSAPLPWRRRSRATAEAEAGWWAPPRSLAVGRRQAAHGGAAAGFAPPLLQRSAGTGLGNSRPCPSLPMVLAPAGGCVPSTLRVCALRGGLWRPLRRQPQPRRWHPPSSPGSGNRQAAAAPPADGAGAPGRAHPEPPPAPRRCACARGRGGSGAPPPPRTRVRDADGGSVGARRRGGRRRRAPRRRGGCRAFLWRKGRGSAWRQGGGGVEAPRGCPAGPPSTCMVCVAETAQGRLYGAPVVAAL